MKLKKRTLKITDFPLLLKKITKRTATHFKSVYNKFDSKKKSEADEKADELIAELLSESIIKQRR